jgi:hypothetical protein
MSTLVQFLFILVLPVVVVLGGLASLFAVGALFDAMEHPEELRRRIDGAFRQPAAAPRTTAPDHYYRPHWSGGAR